jgi:hypothetical protein
MKKVCLLIVTSALLVTLGFAQTPAAGASPDQTNVVKGCLGGSDGNYTVAEDGTRQNFKITTSSVDLKPHLGHDVELTGHKASGAVSSGAADNSFAVTELKMISEHCAAAAAAPVVTVSPSTAIVVTPAVVAAAPPAPASPASPAPNTPAATAAANSTAPAPAVSPSTTTVVVPAATPAVDAATTPAAPASPASVTVVTPAAPAAAPASPTSVTVTPPVADAAAVPAAPVSPAPAASPEVVVAPAVVAVAPPTPASAPTATVITEAADEVRPTRQPAHHRKAASTHEAASTAPDQTVTTSADAATPPAADAATPVATATPTPSSQAASTPTTPTTAPVAAHKGWSLSLLIGAVVVVIVLGTLVPFVNRWRRQKSLDKTGEPNLSFTTDTIPKEATSDEGARPEPRKVA